jgi:hypothetical protein
MPGLAPSITVNAATGELTIVWPEPRPATFEATPEVLEQLVSIANTNIRAFRQARSIFVRLGEIGAAGNIPQIR